MAESCEQKEQCKEVQEESSIEAGHSQVCDEFDGQLGIEDNFMLSACAANRTEFSHDTCADKSFHSGESRQQANTERSEARAMEHGVAHVMESSSHDEVLRDQFNFIQNVSQFYNTEDLSDVTIKVSDLTYYGHRFVLAKSSDVFRHMLYEKQWVDAEKPQLVLNESPECEAVFDKFLRYLYTAEISISTMSAVGVLCLADKYNVGSLKELCTQYMSENSRSPRVHNALNWYSWAKALHLPPLKDQCTKTLAWNFSDIIRSPDWSHMDVDYVEDLMRNSELVVQNEYTVWKSLKGWLEAEWHQDKLVEYATRLIPLVRFPQMLVSQLYEIESSDLYGHEDLQPLLHKLISKAYRFRSLCPSQRETGVSFSEKFYLPRDYKDLTVDTVRMQNTLRFGIQVDVKMYKGPVPTETREGEWKITYRKQGEIWSLQLYSHETALINSEARVQTSILIYNEEDHVIQVHREPVHVCTRGNTHTIQMSVIQMEDAKNMSILIKPVPH